jgi:hypothetical protein
MDNKYKEDLTRMGYRPMAQKGETDLSADVWGKPIGHTLFLVAALKTGIEWSQWFQGANDNKSLCWDRRAFGKDESFLVWLKNTEEWCCKTGWMLNSSPEKGTYDFLTIVQSIDYEL